jgi:hypothetical protein
MTETLGRSSSLHHLWKWNWEGGSENSVLWFNKQGNKICCSADVWLVFLCKFYMQGTQVQTLFEDILVSNEASPVPHISLTKQRWQCLRTIISFLDLRNIFCFSRSLLTPSDFKKYCEMLEIGGERGIFSELLIISGSSPPTLCYGVVCISECFQGPWTERLLKAVQFSLPYRKTEQS